MPSESNVGGGVFVRFDVYGVVNVFLHITSDSVDKDSAMSCLISLVIKPLAYISFPLFVVQRIATQPTPTPLRYYARLVVYVSTLLTVASCSFVAAVGMTIIGRPYDTNQVVARIFYTVIHKTLDLKIELEGEEYMAAKPAVFMSNHQSMIDVFVLGR